MLLPIKVGDESKHHNTIVWRMNIHLSTFLLFTIFHQGIFTRVWPTPISNVGGFTKMDATGESPSLVGHRQFGNSAVNLSWVKYGDLRTWNFWKLEKLIPNDSLYSPTHHFVKILGPSFDNGSNDPMDPVGVWCRAELSNVKTLLDNRENIVGEDKLIKHRTEALFSRHHQSNSTLDAQASWKSLLGFTSSPLDVSAAEISISH